MHYDSITSKTNIFGAIVWNPEHMSDIPKTRNQYLIATDMLFAMSKRIKLHKVLEREMKIRNLSLRRVSKDCDISKATLHGYLNQILPSGKNLHYIDVLAKYFSLSLSQLLYDEQEDTESKYITLFSSFFSDNGESYRITLEKKR